MIKINPKQLAPYRHTIYTILFCCCISALSYFTFTQVQQINHKNQIDPIVFNTDHDLTKTRLTISNLDDNAKIEVKDGKLLSVEKTDQNNQKIAYVYYETKGQHTVLIKGNKVKPSPNIVHLPMNHNLIWNSNIKQLSDNQLQIEIETSDVTLNNVTAKYQIGLHNVETNQVEQVYEQRNVLLGRTIVETIDTDQLLKGYTYRIVLTIQEDTRHTKEVIHLYTFMA